MAQRQWPGTNVTNGSHGCVDLPLDGMVQLYNFAVRGTAVGVY